MTLKQVARLYAGSPQPSTVADLEDRFRRMATPEETLARLELVLAAVDLFAGSFARSGENPADIYALACQELGWPASGHIDSGTVSAERAGAIRLWLRGSGSTQWRANRTSALRGLMAGRLLGPPRLTLSELLDPAATHDPIALMASAQTILRVNAGTGEESQLFHIQVVGTNTIDEGGERVLRIEFDPDSEGRLGWLVWTMNRMILPWAEPVNREQLDDPGE